MVEGDVPDGCRLLLDPRLPARHRRPRGGPSVPGGNARAGRADPHGRPPGLPPRRRGEPSRGGLDRDARAAAQLLEGQAVRPGPAGIRRYRLHHHDDALRGRCLGAPDREPQPPFDAHRPPGRDHPRPPGPAGRRVPAGLHRGHRPGGRPGRHLPRAQRRRDRRRSLAHRRPSAPGPRLDRGPHPAARQPPGDDRGLADRLPEAGSRDVGLRDGCRGDAPRPGRLDGHRVAPGRSDPRHQATSHHRRGDDERLPGHQLVRHHAADPRRRSSSPAAGPTAGPLPTSRTSTSATPSVRRTTPPRSPSSGSPAPRRWPGCST